MKKTLFLFSAMLMFWACQNLNSIDPPDEFDFDGRYGNYVDTTFYANEAVFQIEDSLATGYGRNLCVGNYQRFNSSFFIKFVLLPSDTMAIDSVYIELTSLGKFGDGIEDLEIEVYEVDQEWDEHTINTLDEWHNYQPQNPPIYTTSVPATDTVHTKIPIDTSLFNNWRYQEDLNNGLLIKMAGDGEGHIREYESFEVANDLDWPKLYYFMTEGDTLSIVDSVRVGFDATVFDYPEPGGVNVFDLAQANQDLLLSSVVPARVLIRFDELSAISKTAIIQAANIELDVYDADIETNSAGNPLNNPNHKVGFYIRSVTEANEDLTSFTVDSSFAVDAGFSFYMQESSDIISLSSSYDKEKFGKNQIQGIVNGDKNSEWFYLHFADEVSTVSVIRLFNLQQADHPIRLRLQYFDVVNSDL